MPYISRIASLVNGADACGGGMKKSGLVYKSDFTRVTRGAGPHGGMHLGKAYDKNYVFRKKVQSDCNRVNAVSTYAVVRRTLLNN